MGLRHADSSTGGGPRSAGSPAGLRPAIVLPALKDPETEPVRQAAYAANRAEAACLEAALEYAEAYLARVEAEARESRAAAAAGESVALLDPALERSAMCMYLAQALGMSENQVSMMVEEGRFAREHCPATWAGLHEGVVGIRHVMRIVDAARRVEDPARIPDLDRQAVAYAAGHRMGQLSAWLRRWIAAAEPQEHAARCAEKVKDRRVWVQPGEDGTSLLCAELPTMTAERIARRLRAVAVSAEQPVPHNPEVGSAGSSRTGSSRAGASTPKHLAAQGATTLAGTRTAATAARTRGASPRGGQSSALDPYRSVRPPVGPEPAAGESAPPGLPQTRAAGDERTLAQREADMLCAWLLNGRTETSIPIDAHIGVMISADSLIGASQQPGVTRDRKTPIDPAALRAVAQDPSSRIRWHEIHHRPPPDRRGPEPELTEPLGRSPAGSATSGAGAPGAPCPPEPPPARSPALMPPSFPASEEDVLAHVYTGRFVPQLLREAVSFRDGVCAAEGCGAAAENCDMDHVVPWPTGQTTGGNIEPLCRRHHRLKTAGHHVTPETCTDAPITSYEAVTTYDHAA